jgi:hypothetical protein
MDPQCTDIIIEETEIFTNKPPLSTTLTYIMTIDTTVGPVDKM